MSRILDSILYYSTSTPNSVALQDDKAVVSYSELQIAIRQQAAALYADGVREGDRVGLLMRRTVDLPIVMLAINALGAAYVPLEPRLPVARIKAIVDGAALDLVVCDTDASFLPNDVAGVRPARDASTDVDLGAHLSDSLASYIMYTSGSSGTPKGVEVTRRNLRWFVDAMRDRFVLDETLKILALTSVSFDISFVELFLPLAVGGCSYVANGEEGAGTSMSMNPIERAFESFEPTLFQCTPTVLSVLLASDQIAGALARLQLLLVGGEVLPPALARRVRKLLPDVDVYNMYGPTEATIWCTSFCVSSLAAPPSSPIPIGEPLQGVLTRVIAPKDNQGGAEGELVVGGDCVAKGYWQAHAEESHRFFEEDGATWYRTGDRVQETNEGFAYLGRSDRQTKISGVRIELDEVERALTDLTEVGLAAVTTRQTGLGVKQIVAYVQPASSRSDQEAISRWQTVWDAEYSHVKESLETAGQVGWNSSYTGLPYDAVTMRNWADLAAERVSRLNPERLLDVGAGAGELGTYLAPNVRSYTGLDVSPIAVELANSRFASVENAQVMEADASRLSSFEHLDFDVIVLNSVVQYFPSGEYLWGVLADCLRIVGDRGAVFLGDARLRHLKDLFHYSVVSDGAGSYQSSSQMADVVRLRSQNDPELFVTVDMLEKLSSRSGAHLQVELKRSCLAREMGLFRHDVTLLGSRRAEVEQRPEGVSWDRNAGAQQLDSRFRSGAESIRVQGIPDPELTPIARSWGRLTSDSSGSSASSVPVSLEELEDMANTYEFDVRFFLPKSVSGDPTIDAVFARRDSSFRIRDHASDKRDRRQETSRAALRQAERW